MVNSKSKKYKVELDNVMYQYSSNVHQLEEENKLLKEHILQLKRELEKMRKPPLMVCELRELVNKGLNGLIRVPNGNEFFVEIANDFKGKQGDSVLVDQKNLCVMKPIQSSKKFNVESFVIVEKPDVSWKEVGGLDHQINEIKEVVELPLSNPELFKKVGISPPKGILLHGPPGTGKTILAKAVAASTNSTFIEIVGSELVQKFIGEGAKLVKEVFQLARQKAPSIIFIDEIDALAAKRIEIGTSGEREVQRTFMQLLAEIDGFKPLGNIKVIGCTNRKDILDPAVVRPGRLDRLIHVGVPDEDGRKQIFKIHTKNMKLDKRISLDKVAKEMDGFSGAEIKAACTEAGYFAIRAKKKSISLKNIMAGIAKVKSSESEEGEDYLNMFG